MSKYMFHLYIPLNCSYAALRKLSAWEAIAKNVVSEREGEREGGMRNDKMMLFRKEISFGDSVEKKKGSKAGRDNKNVCYVNTTHCCR